MSAPIHDNEKVSEINHAAPPATNTPVAAAPAEKVERKRDYDKGFETGTFPGGAPAAISLRLQDRSLTSRTFRCLLQSTSRLMLSSI